MCDGRLKILGRSAEIHCDEVGIGNVTMFKQKIQAGVTFAEILFNENNYEKLEYLVVLSVHGFMVGV